MKSRIFKPSLNCPQLMEVELCISEFQLIIIIRLTPHSRNRQKSHDATCTADPRETAFLYQRISVAIQRFNKVCLANTFTVFESPS